ncbi:hypothetical protein CPB97_010279 [Podila verticillata]|nr:hypothetical protein CPB97_010279 [Podila verticillata]
MEYQNYDESFDGKPEEFELEQHIQQPQVQQQPQPSTRPPRRSTKSLSSAYAAWAQSQAKGSAFFLVAGGILCLFFPDWYSGVYSICLGAFVYYLETASETHTKPKRLSQNHPSTTTTSCSPVSVLAGPTIRALFYLVSSVPCFLRAPSYTGGLCLVSSALTYALAAFVEARKQARKKRAMNSGSTASAGSTASSRARRIILGFSSGGR